MRKVLISEVVKDEDLTIGDEIEVSVGGKIYISYIDSHETQRFRNIKNHKENYDNGLYDLNKLAVDYHLGKISQINYLELMLGIEYSICGFSELSSFHDLQLINPLWGYKQPEDIYLFAALKRTNTNPKN